ncbi:MAG: hypothetical protein KJ717_13695, partial [Proteobacteria bacterium]|nr:hypothetical protein [Pseudomonadota bacterium]
MQCSSDSDSILGVFYDGCQNTNISILSRDGREIISYHLGDLTGKKSDGRSPKPLIDKLSINDFSACAWPFKNTISSNEEQLGKIRSQFHTVTHHFQNFDANLFSPDIFQAFVQSIPLPHEWWGYPESLAAFSYFTSGKTKGSIILVYDQPTWNSPFFGGVFLGKGCSLQALELFHQGTHCCFSSFWNAVSLMIDLNPYNARPQVELLAAGSEPNSRCIDILYDIFVNDFGELSSGIKWNVSQAEMLSPLLLINETLFSDFRDKMSKFSKGCIAASLQSLLLAHLQEIIDKLAAAGLSDSIYLAGELFQSPQLRANLMAQSGFDTVFMSTVNAKREASAGAALLSWGKHYGELPCLRESATRLKCFTAPKEDFLYEEKLKDFAEKVASHITKKDQEIDKLQEIVNKKNQEIERLQGAVIASMSFRNCIRILPSACFFGFQRRFLKLC